MDHKNWCSLDDFFFSKLSHIPGPERNSFFFGNAELIKSGLKKYGDFGVLFLELMLEYGDIYILWRATSPIVFTADLKVVKEYYTNLKLFQKRKERETYRIGKTNYFGRHSILSDPGGPIWERKKRILDPGFKISRLQEQISKFYLIGERVALDLENAQLQNGFVDFDQVISPNTIHAISSAGFSVTEEGKLEALSKGNALIDEYFVSRIAQSNPLKKTKLAALLGLDNPEGKRATTENQLKYIRGLGKQLIMDRIESGRFGRISDMLDFIIKANEENGEVKMERCVDDFMAMYAAGNATTSTTLGFFLAEMIRNEHMLQKLVEEVDEIWVERGISRNSSNQEIVTALKDMVYLDAVLNETLRRHPPITVGSRTLQKDIEILGHKVPAGVLVSVSQKALHHHPKYWDNPDTFDPERFLGNKEIVPFTFIPFIVGPRKCIGKNFAILQMKIFLSIWLSRMTFEKLPDCEEEIVTEQSLLVRIVDNRMAVRIR